MLGNWLKSMFGPSMRASELASLLFSECVLADQQGVMETPFVRYKNEPGFRPDTFEQRVFLYLVANIAIALSDAASKRPHLFAVIEHFRTLVRAEMSSRWRYNHEFTDDAVKRAAGDYAKLLFTNREANRALSFEWSREWLREVGIEETNPQTLFEISHTWMIHHVTLAKFIRKVKVVGLSETNSTLRRFFLVA